MNLDMDVCTPTVARAKDPCPVIQEACPVEWATALIHTRQTILPKRLAAPGPDALQLDLILDAASAAPDHCELLPWRFVIVASDTRSHLGRAFAEALLERDTSATPAQLSQAREKAVRAPLLLLAVARLGLREGEIPAAERLVSAGCAIQNMLLMATALGFASSLTSGKALQSRAMRKLFSLEADEQALCFLNFGTALVRKAVRQRPHRSRYVSLLVPPA